MRCLVFLLSTAVIFPLANAQDPPRFNLRGDRFPGLKYSELTPAQKVIADRALAGRGPIGTFNVTLRSPELVDATRSLLPQAGAALSPKQSELAILLSGRFWSAQFEFVVHHRAAVQAGLSEETVRAIIDGKRPPSLQPDEVPVYNFLAELLNTKQVSDATFQATKEKLGERGIVDIIGWSAFYQTASIMMNVDRYPLTAGQTAELKVIPNPVPAYSSGIPDGAPVRATSAPNQLRGARFKPIATEEMTPPQKNLFDLVTSGKIQGGTGGPLNVLLRDPELGEAVLHYGAYERFQTPLPAKLNELTALITIRNWGAQFPWYAHHRAGKQAGLSDAVIGAIAEGKRPEGLQPDEQAVYNFCTELYRTTQLSDATFNAIKQQLGERGIVEVMGIMGYYQTVSMLLNTDRYPLPDGVAPELKPLANPMPK